MRWSVELISIAPGPEDTDLIVKFRYRAAGSGKQIESLRTFRVEDGNVSLVVSD